MLFKKKNPEPAKNNQAVNNQQSQAVSAKDIRFSQRIAGVFGMMYRLIISVDLGMNVYQVESGETRIADVTIPERGHYDSFFKAACDSVYEEEAEQFAAAFSRAALMKAMKESDSGVALACRFKSKSAAEEEQSSSSYAYYEVRAEVIPDNQGLRSRCIIYVRRIKGGTEIANRMPASEGSAEKHDWNSARVRKLLGGENTILFEYDSVSDRMYVHQDGAQSNKSEIVENYLKNISLRSDWTIFHNDVQTVKDLLKGALKGKNGSGEIKYRTNPSANAPYHTYRISCAPAEDGAEVRWVVGTLADIEKEVTAQNISRDIENHLVMLMQQMFTDIYEIDLEGDFLYRLEHTENGFARAKAPRKLSSYIEEQIAAQKIAPEFAKAYRLWLQPGYLSRETLNGSFEYESRLKLPGSLEYKWYRETIYALNGGKSFIRFRSDCSDLHEAQRKNYELGESKRYAQYSGKMLDMLANLVEFRNIESGVHISNVRKLTRILLEDVAVRSPGYNLTEQDIEIYTEAAVMHDIGKICVPDSILNKPGRFTDEERSIMQLHTVDGARIIERIELPGQEKMLAACRDVALHHHERFDGKGYPEGLKGDNISIAAQVVSIADTYDALVSKRCYKDAFEHDNALNMIISGECGVINPRLLESLKACIDKITALYTEPEQE